MSETKEMLDKAEKAASTQYIVNFVNNSDLDMQFLGKDINNGNFNVDPTHKISSNGGRGQWQFLPNPGQASSGDVSYTTSSGAVKVSWENARNFNKTSVFSQQTPIDYEISFSHPNGPVTTATMEKISDR